MDRLLFDVTAGLGRHRKLAVLGAAAAWGALYFAMRAAGSVDALLAWVPFRCPLRLFTGIECPTCGLGHALLEAAAGDFGASWRHHPAGLLLWAATIAGLMAAAITPSANFAALARLRALTARRAVVVAALLLYTLWGLMRAS